MIDDFNLRQDSGAEADPKLGALEFTAGEMLDLSESIEPLDTGLVPERVPESQYCVFRAGRERFCLSVLSIEEVVDWPPVTRLPLGPSFLMGVFNLRGSIVPLVDIAFTEGRRTGLLPRHVVVASLEDGENAGAIRFGIAADEVIGTYTAADESLLDQVPSEIPHCRGMLRHDDRLALVLDLKKLIEVFPVPVI